MRIVYNSFEGRFSDSPRVLFDALQRALPHAEHVWLADPVHREAFPADVATVPYEPEAAAAVLEDAELVVANTHIDLPWRMRSDALYMQTWHGTPLKRIHHDVLWAPEGRLARLDGDVARWSVLLSPNAVSTPRLRHAFRYSGEVLETGYPRNDVLTGPFRDEIRARVRAELGIPDGATAVLYAPTWRDDAVFQEGGKDFALGLDVGRFADALGDHVLLLRLHYMLTGRLAAMTDPTVRDVSTRPDIAELYLAADVLVTDYSSVMFDFAVTGRPQIVFAYDLADYRDRLRGFYFDLEPVAPGPVVETTDELVDALRDLPRVVADNAERYAAFRATFCHLEDGHATDRALERILRDVRG